VNEKSLISRLAEAYNKTAYTYFVTDGEGNCMAEGMTEVDARVYAMKYGYSIGRTEVNSSSPVNLNSEGVEISYENKDILSEEDFQ
jgi:hypothetical protein